ncbi:MAG: YqgE/AlgH family protein [Pseudomonadota bacterium]
MSKTGDRTQNIPHSLCGQLLISMPLLDDPNFHQTVTLICKHDDDGAMGLVLNRESEFQLQDVFSELSMSVRNLRWTQRPVLVGGPVSPELGLVLHCGGEQNIWESTMEVAEDLYLTSSRDILQAMASGNGPKSAQMCLGYAGWSSGQLEAEIQQNAWFSAPPNTSVIFDDDADSKWQRAAALLGIDIASMSNQVGHA